MPESTVGENDNYVVNQSTSCSAGSVEIVSKQLKDFSLSADGHSAGFHNISRLLTDSGSGKPRCWTSDGFVSKSLSDTASSRLLSENAEARLTSDDCSDSIGNHQQLSCHDMASANHVAQCEQACKCSQDNNLLLSGSSEELELFSCHECSIRCRKHFAHDSLRVSINVFRSFDIDCSMFYDASLTVVKNELYFIEVLKVHFVVSVYIYFFCAQ